jgi:hypothetical protein
MLGEKLSQNYGANNLIHQKTKKKTESHLRRFFFIRACKDGLSLLKKKMLVDNYMTIFHLTPIHLSLDPKLE